jgi:hypothetical protein
MNTHYRSLVLFLLILIFSTATAFAEIRVLSVKGTAAYKEGARWIPLKAGTLLKEGVKVSTGVRSTVGIKINNNTVTVRPLTIMKISQSREDAKSSTTLLGLRRGSLRADVPPNARIRTVFKVSTPVATSSVRGCGKVVAYGPTFGMRIFVLSGIVEGESANSSPRLLSGDLQFWQKPSRPTPENIMVGMENFIAKTHSQFITLDEQKAIELLGDDFMFYEPGQQSQQGGETQNLPVPVRIYLIWPQ